MLFNLGKFYFSPSPFIFWFSLIMLLALAVLCVLGVLHSLRKGRAITLESLRFFIASLVVLLLWNPEIRTFEPPKDDPIILIFSDYSYSMETVDAKVASIFGDTGDDKIISRKKWVELAQNNALWQDLKSKDKKIGIKHYKFAEHNPEKKRNKKGSDYHQEIAKALKKHDNIKAIIILGDGDHNQGLSPYQAASQARAKDIPIFTVPVGSKTYLPDLSIESLSAPKYGIVGESIQIPFSIKSTLKKDLTTKLTLTEKKSGKTLVQKVTLPANDTLHSSLLWKLQEEKNYNFELKITHQSNEVSRENNTQLFSLDAKKENIKVLVIESTPRWEYRFIRNALSRDPGVDLDCLLLHPKIGKGNGPDYIQAFPQDLAQLQKYDVIFLGDVGIGKNQLTIEQADLLEGLIKNQASGIVLIPGRSGNLLSLLTTKKEEKGEKDKVEKEKKSKKSKLADLFPVEIDTKKIKGINNKKIGTLSLTDLGKKSLLTMLGDSSEQNSRIWKNLPGFNWHAPVLKAKVGTQILAVHSNNKAQNNQRMPMLITQNYGSGKVLFLAHDSAWKWRKGVEDLYHYRFWGQVARWMSYKRNRAAGENLRLHFSSENPKIGDTVIIKANAFDSNGAPLQKGTVQLNIITPQNKKQTLQLEKEPGAWGAYIGYLRITNSGSWKITAHTSEDPHKKIKTTIDTLQIELEKKGTPANFNTLKEMAQVSGGKMITNANDIPQIIESIHQIPKRQPQANIINLREDQKYSYRWWLLILILSLLAIFWTGRKFNGTF